MDKEKVRALAENVRELLTLHEERNETMKELLKACLLFLEDVQISAATTRHLSMDAAMTLLQRKRELVRALAEVLNDA